MRFSLLINFLRLIFFLYRAMRCPGATSDNYWHAEQRRVLINHFISLSNKIFFLQFPLIFLKFVTLYYMAQTRAHDVDATSRARNARERPSGHLRHRRPARLRDARATE